MSDRENGNKGGGGGGIGIGICEVLFKLVISACALAYLSQSKPEWITCASFTKTHVCGVEYTTVSMVTLAVCAVVYTFDVKSVLNVTESLLITAMKCLVFVATVVVIVLVFSVESSTRLNTYNSMHAWVSGFVMAFTPESVRATIISSEHASIVAAAIATASSTASAAAVAAEAAITTAARAAAIAAAATATVGAPTI
jgi:hypothetical protein